MREIKKPDNFDAFAKKYLFSNRTEKYTYKQFLEDTALKPTNARKFLEKFKEELKTLPIQKNE
jgi:hypothetical protein